MVCSAARVNTGKLKEIAALKKKYDFRLLVNDADGFGIEGKNGKGTGDHFGVNDDIDIYLASFSKVFGCIGGFAAGPEDIMNFPSLPHPHSNSFKGPAHGVCHQHFATDGLFEGAS